MHTKEIIEDNYMVALLRAALLLGDLHRSTPVHEITISGFHFQNSIRMLFPRCKIVASINSRPYSADCVIPTSPGEDYLILYPLRKAKSIPS